MCDKTIELFVSAVCDQLGHELDCVSEKLASVPIGDENMPKASSGRYSRKETH